MKSYLVAGVLSSFCLAAAFAGAQELTKASTAGTSDKSTAAATQQGGVVNGGVAKSWQVADEDRITRRAHAGGRARAESASATTHGYKEGIDGRVSPELFMPYELFDHLLLALISDANLAKRAHTLFDHKVRAFGYDENRFWNALRSAALPYLSSREGHEKRHQRSTIFQLPDGRNSFVTINRDDCKARIQALQNARQQLGGGEFDRFLYSMIAPDFQYSEGGSAPDRAAQLRYMARGCK